MIDPLTPDDLGAVLTLNNQHAEETSPLDASALEALFSGSALALGIASGRDAFLIAFDQTARYDSPNFAWFRARYDRFVYIDRVVVAPSRRGEGLGRALCGAVFAAARRTGADLVCCEVNLKPPNPGSDAFHARLGFEELGRAALPGRGKTVRYLGAPPGGPQSPPGG